MRVFLIKKGMAVHCLIESIEKITPEIQSENLVIFLISPRTIYIEVLFRYSFIFPAKFYPYDIIF